jgi:hypothetical protein
MKLNLKIDEKIIDNEVGNQCRNLLKSLEIEAELL